MWMKSKTGMWHKVGRKFTDGMIVAKCQSYNLDRPNPLSGDSVSATPEGAKVCKKCSKTE